MVADLEVGDIIGVCDNDENYREYTIYWADIVSDPGYDSQGQYIKDQILDQSGEEITLQTCLDDYYNYLYFAR